MTQCFQGFRGVPINSAAPINPSFFRNSCLLICIPYSFFVSICGKLYIQVITPYLLVEHSSTKFFPDCSG